MAPHSGIGQFVLSGSVRWVGSSSACGNCTGTKAVASVLPQPGQDNIARQRTAAVRRQLVSFDGDL
jgi:hypothetical protein